MFSLNICALWRAHGAIDIAWQATISITYAIITLHPLPPACQPTQPPITPRFNKFRHALTNVGANGKAKSIKLLFSRFHTATYSNTRWGLERVREEINMASGVSRPPGEAISE